MRILWKPPVAILFLLCACSLGRNADIARLAVNQFHAELNAGRIDGILVNASQEYRQAVTVEQNRKLLTAIRKKLGEAGDWSVVALHLNSAPSGNLVSLQCKTRFTNGEAIESFMWRVNGNYASLVGYNINSLALLSDQDVSGTTGVSPATTEACPGSG